MKKTRRYSIEGVQLEIPLHYDELTGKAVSYTHLTLPTTERV